MDSHLVQRYGSEGGAAAYRRKYDRSLLRRWSNRRELHVVDRALTEAGTRGRVLDCPCGAGRLVPTLLGHAEHVSATDASGAMVDEARDALATEAAAGRVAFTVASVESLPFPDDHFDTAVCHRLIHHVADPAERARMLSELARVAKRRVVLSFNDATTFKHRLQMRRGRARRRVAFEPDALWTEAAACGLHVLGTPRRLNGYFSLVAIAVLGVEGAEE